MNRREAQSLLAAWREGRSDPGDPNLEAALKFAREDPQVRDWFAQQQAFHQGVRDALQAIPVPPDLAERILARAKTTRPTFVRGSRALLAAAAGVLALLIALPWLPRKGGDQPDFATFRHRLVRAALREYRMDIETNNLAEIRGFLARGLAPAAFELPPSLEALPPVGCGVLSWQGEPVSMVCFNGDRLGMVFLFVVPARNLADAPPASLRLEQVNKLGTASWTRGDQTYVLAAGASLDDIRQLLKAAGAAQFWPEGA